MRTVASGGARRDIVVLPAPETPAKRNARLFRIALAAWSRKPPCSARTSECVMRRTVSIEYGIRALGDAAVAGARIPGGVEIAAAKMPERAGARDAGVFIGGAAGGVEMDFEAAGRIIAACCSRRGITRGECFVAGFENVAEIGVAGLEKNWDAADFDGDGGELALAHSLQCLFESEIVGEGGAAHQANLWRRSGDAVGSAAVLAKFVVRPAMRVRRRCVASKKRANVGGIAGGPAICTRKRAGLDDDLNQFAATLNARDASEKLAGVDGWISLWAERHHAWQRRRDCARAICA